MKKMAISSRTTFGAFGAVIAVVGSILIFNAITNNSTGSDLLIPQNGFGDYEMESSYLSNAELYGEEEIPSFIDDLNWIDYFSYGEDYIVAYEVEDSLDYNGSTEYFHETYFSLMSSTGVFLWTHHFEFSEAYALGSVFFERDAAIEIEHMT